MKAVIPKGAAEEDGKIEKGILGHSIRGSGCKKWSENCPG